MKTRNRNVVITGAASGIGHELVKLFLAEDCRIVAADLVAEGIPVDDLITIVRFDAAEEASVDNLFTQAIDILGNIDIFVANAGFAYYEAYNKADWNRIETIFRVNVLSPLYTVARMAELYPGGDYRVVCTASAMAQLSMPGYAVYSSTKAALHGFAEGYKHEPGVRNNLSLVYPIATRTAFFAEAGNDIPVAFPTQSAVSVARSILKGIQRNRRKIVPSLLFQVMLFINRLFPPALALYLKSERRKFNNWLNKDTET